VNGEPLSLADFSHDVKQALRSKAKILREIKDQNRRDKELKAIKMGVADQLVIYELIEQEALKRNYMRIPAFSGMVEKRQQNLLVETFKAKLVYPLAIPAEEEYTQYYEENLDEFKEGYEVWIRDLVFEEKAEAEKILEELKQGANFEFLVAERSGGVPPKRDTIWISVNRFPATLRNVIKDLRVGAVSDVISHGRKYKIIKLKGKRGGKPIPFSEVSQKVENIVRQKKFQTVLSEYLVRMRETADIQVNEKALEEIEARYWHLPSTPESQGFSSQGQEMGETP
jgi:parvulin-like peptidyl-prolyl isomerase